MKKLSGISAPVGGNDINDLFHLIADNSPTESPQASMADVASNINQAFFTLMSAFSPLPPATHADFLLDYVFQVSELSVLQKLSVLNPRIASGPDGIPG